jgi:tetratricopeptide (TPR) repeat protein
MVPFMRGQIQFRNNQYADAQKSFIQALTKLKTTQPSELGEEILIEIFTLASTDNALPDVTLFFIENFSSKKERMSDEGWRSMFAPEDRGSIFAPAWCKVHKNDLAAGKFELFLRRAKAEPDDVGQAEYVRAVIREQMRRGRFADVPKTIDRIFPPGAAKKKVAGDVEANYGRFDGRDLCLETWAIGCTQRGRLAEARSVVESIEEERRRVATLNKMIGVLIGEDVKVTVYHGLQLDTQFGGDKPDSTIPAPKYTEAELLEFFRWYAATAEQQPHTMRKIQRTAAAAGMMLRLGFKKEANELFDKAFADVLAIENDWMKVSAAEAIIIYWCEGRDPEAALDFIEKLPENGIEVSVEQKIQWFCAIGKIDEAIALAGTDKDHWELINHTLSLINNKEHSKKFCEKVLASEEMIARLEEICANDIEQAGMFTSHLALAETIDEALRCVERFSDVETRVATRGICLMYIAQQLRQAGNTEEADKALLEAVKILETVEMDEEDRRDQMFVILMELANVDMLQLEQCWGRWNKIDY